MRSFVYSDESSHKFWSIQLQGNQLTVSWGKVGSAGQTQVKTFPSEAAARKEHDKLVAEKTRKGYVETTAAAPPAPVATTLRESLEQALIADPEDRAAAMAYADWLSEQSGAADTTLAEFMRVQMALEDPSLPADERKKLQQREKILLMKHEQEWAGDWVGAALYTGPEGRGQLDFPKPRPVKFVRGLPAEAVVGDVTPSCARAFINSPQTRFLRKLGLGGPHYAFPDEGEEDPEINSDDAAIELVARWPHAANLRVFQFGWTSDEKYGEFCHFQCHLNGSRVHELVRKMPRLEELYLFAHAVDGDKLFPLPLPRLRVLQVYHSHRYPLEKLAKNASLTSLTHLLFHPHAYEGEEMLTLKGLKALARSPHLKALTHLRLRLTLFGDAGVREIISSGLIDRLKMLDLRNGRVSDVGARLLADCPAVRKLEMLDLSRNELTGAGIAALQATGVPLDVSHQHGSTADVDPDDYYELEFLMEADYE